MKKGPLTKEANMVDIVEYIEEDIMLEKLMVNLWWTLIKLDLSYMHRLRYIRPIRDYVQRWKT